jgi:hypothetical protein
LHHRRGRTRSCKGPVAEVAELAGNADSIGKSLGVHRAGLGAKSLLESFRDNLGLSVLWGRDLTLSSHPEKGGVGIGSHLTALGVCHLIGNLLKLREELWEERCGIMGVLDELGHVVNNDSRLPLDGSGALPESADEEGDNDGEGGTLNLLDKGGGSKLMDAVSGLSLRGRREEARGQERM